MRAFLIGLSIVLTSAASACDGSESMTGTPSVVADRSRELIVLAAPESDDPYYGDVTDAIIEFHIGFAELILQSGDEVIILSDEGLAPTYRAALGDERVLVAPQSDIWVRDFGLSNTGSPLMFRYTAEGQGGGDQGQRQADEVQDTLAILAEAAGLDFLSSEIFNDGGNWVDDGQGNAVVSRKLLVDNDMSEAEARAALRVEAGIRNIAFIDADEQGGLEHADGVVAFVGPNTLIINSYDEDPVYAAALKADLERGLPGVELHSIITPYDGLQIYDERFGSACGLYTNALVTANRIYLPQFGIPEDAVAVAQVSAVTELDVVPVPSAGVCHMGGGVRCLSWQIRDANADRLLYFARMQAR